MRNPLKFFAEFWKSFVVIGVPLLCLPLLILVGTKEARCGYVIILMGVFWMTEVVPMAMTSLIPIFGFPLLGVMSTEDICYVYMKETNMMFLGGLLVAIAVEHSNLHRRIALAVILKVGQSPLQLMAGFMLTTMFLSMWISNTASTAMMVPIVDAILQEFYKTYGADDTTDLEKDVSNGGKLEITDGKNLREDTTEAKTDKKLAAPEIVTESTSLTATPPNAKCRAFRDMFFLATAYGANLGGTGSYTGSGTNLVLKGVLRSLFTEPTNLNFASWLIFNVPGMIISGLLTFFWLKFYFIGFGKRSKLSQSSPERRKAIKKILQKKFDELGPMSFHESVVLFWFIILVLLWLFLAPGFIMGWGDLIKRFFGTNLTIDDATSAILVVFILFCIPARPNFLWFKDPKATKFPSSSPGCLTWKVAQEKLPWGIVLLMGGGFAMAKAAQDSGLSLWLGQQLKYLEFMPPAALLLCICVITAMATEIASNAATASLLLPVLKDLSLALCINPLYLMLPATLCCSYAFMLPVATPPNAIVYGAANIDSRVMMKAGFVPNILCVLTVTFMINVYAIPILGINTMPAWANSSVNGYLPQC